MRTSLGNKIQNCKYGFVQNFWYHLIAPLCILVLSLVLILCFNFNLGLDFTGGTVVTVVVEQDLTVQENYNSVKSQLDDVLSENNIKGLYYQQETTNYYGDAIIVRFGKIDEQIAEQLRADLIETFHVSTSQDDLERFVQVDDFGPNVQTSVLTSTVLAVLVGILVVLIYMWIRHGTTAGFLSLFIYLFDIIMTISIIGVTRIPVDMSTIISLAFVAMYSLFNTYLFVNKVNSNLKQEKFAKDSKVEISNMTVKSILNVNLLFACILLIFTLLLGVVPTSSVRALSLPCLVGVLVCFLSSVFITPGLWSLTYIKRKHKVKTTKKEEQVVVETKTIEEVTKQPEVIVETEAKEN